MSAHLPYWYPLHTPVRMPAPHSRPRPPALVATCGQIGRPAQHLRESRCPTFPRHLLRWRTRPGHKCLATGCTVESAPGPPALTVARMLHKAVPTKNRLPQSIFTVHAAIGFTVRGSLLIYVRGLQVIAPDRPLSSASCPPRGAAATGTARTTGSTSSRSPSRRWSWATCWTSRAGSCGGGRSPAGAIRS